MVSFPFFTFFILFFKKLFRFSFLDIFKNVHFQEILKTLQIKCFFSYWKYFWILLGNSVSEKGDKIWTNIQNIFYAVKIVFFCPFFPFFVFLDIFRKRKWVSKWGIYLIVYFIFHRVNQTIKNKKLLVLEKVSKCVSKCVEPNK